MPVLVQNLQAGPTVLSNGKDLNLEWQGKDDPSGNDVQYVPDDVVTKVEFITAVRKGIFKVINPSEEVSQMLAGQDASYRARQDAIDAAARAAIDPEVHNDLISLPCIGPANRGLGTCGDPVTVREKDQDKAPVLCTRHASLAPEYVQIETGESKVVGDRLVPVTQWVRALVTGPEKEV